MKDLLCNYDSDMLKYVTSEGRSFSLTGIKFKIEGWNNGWIHAAENNRSSFDDLEFQLIATVNVKTLCENLKTPVWYFDVCRHEVSSKFVFEVMNLKLFTKLPPTY